MKLHVAGVVGVTLGALLLFSTGCGRANSAGAKAPLVGTTTITSAPMVPDALIPAVIWDEPEEPAVRAAETWGVKPPTPEQLETYGF